MAASRPRALLHLALALGLMVVFLYWAFKDVDGWGLVAQLRSASLTWTAALVATTLGTLIVRARRWTVLMASFAPQVTVRDATVALAICYAANVVVPRSGEALRAVSLKWTRGVVLSAALATVLVERILDIVFLLLCLGISFLLVHDRIAELFPWMATLGLVAFAGCIVMLVVLFAISVYQERAVSLLVGGLGRVWPSAAVRTGALLRTFLAGLDALRSPSSYLEILVGSVVLNVGYVMIIYEGFRIVDLGTGYGLDFGASLVIMTLSAFGVAVPTPGAAGSYHLFFSKSLVHLYGVPQDKALACATAVHAIATLAYLCTGGPALLWQRRNARAAAAAASEPLPPA